MTEPQPPSPESEAPAEEHTPKAHLVRCPHHGRLYNANRESGCRQCQEEGITADSPVTARPRKAGGGAGLSRNALIGILLGIVAVVALGLYLSKGGPAETAAGPAEPIAAAARVGAGGDDAISRGRARSNRWDPAVYESPIKALEIALYEAPAGDAYVAATRADGAARLLIAQVLARNTTSGVAQQFRTALETAVGRLTASAEGGYVLPDFYSARGNWERIRTEYFQDAPWYHAPMALREVGVGEGGARQGAQEETPAFYRVSAYMGDLERILRTHREAVLSFPGRGERQLSGDEAAQLITEYSMFARLYNDELTQAERNGPRSWRATDASFRALAGATTELGRAMTALRSAAPTSGVPTRTVRTNALRTAETAIGRARTALAAASSEQAP